MEIGKSNEDNLIDDCQHGNLGDMEIGDMIGDIYVYALAHVPCIYHIVHSSHSLSMYIWLTLAV